jgi:hypothetical protein
VAIHFWNAYNPNLLLGQTTNVSVIEREGSNSDNQLHDILLKYDCSRSWKLLGSPQPSIPTKAEMELKVDPETCEFENPPLGMKAQSVEEIWEGGTWDRFRLTLFSMLVSSSVLASYSPSTFYTGIVLMLSTILRPAFIFGSWKGWIYECTNPEPIIKVIEGCVMKRHEEDLKGEEESYRILLEIMRSPELFKAISGSSLKGSVDPKLDRLDEFKRQKIEHLEKLEQKGFEVKELKDKLLASA